MRVLTCDLAAVPGFQLLTRYGPEFTGLVRMPFSVAQTDGGKA